MPTPFVWECRIRFVDTDASQRIHYTAMFRHYEAAEVEFLRSIGCEHTRPDMQVVAFPRVHVECDFSGAIRFDDLVQIELTVERVGTSSYTLVFQTLLDGKAVAKGRVTIVCIDRQTQKPCPIPVKLAQELKNRQL